MMGLKQNINVICEGHLIDFSEHSLKYQGSKRCVGVLTIFSLDILKN